MTPQIAQEILDKIVGQVFGYKNPMTLEQFAQKYAFDVRQPMQVADSTTGEMTWVGSTNPAKFMTLNNVKKQIEANDFMVPTQPIDTIETLLSLWNTTNYMATERQLESINIAESDNILKSENVYRSQDVNTSKNVLFSDGAFFSEYVAASQRASNNSFCIKIDDSALCSDSFMVTWSNKATSSYFVSNCYDITDCMFCSHLSGKQYCVANMQYDEAEYRRIKDMVVRWILTS
jgi:hypothetical protein